MWNQGKSRFKMKNSFFLIVKLSISSFMIRAFMSEVISIFEPKLSSFELLSGYFILVSIVAEKKNSFRSISPKIKTPLCS